MHSAQENIRLSGVGISSGVGIGQAFVYVGGAHQFERVYRIKSSETGHECRRIERAFEKVRQDLERSAQMVTEKLDEDFARIFRAHQQMLTDALLREEIREMVEKTRLNAEFVVSTIFRQLEGKIRKSRDAQMAENANDVADLAERILQALTGIHAHELAHLPPNTVVVARQLLPSDTVHFSANTVSAVVVERGGPTSHAAILTRALGIPAISGIEDATEQVSQGQTVLVDGSQGIVILQPDDEQKKAFLQQSRMALQEHADAYEYATAPAITGDGTRINVMANISCHEDATLAKQCGADGVGLYRIEHLYFGRQTLPTEEELYEKLRENLAPFDKDVPVTLRLLDTGGDKPLPFLDYPREATPLLGRRGVRFLLQYPELLSTQLRCFLRLGQERTIRILVPMVTISSDMRAVRDYFEREALTFTRTPPLLGSMIETPAAALCAEEIAQYSDFFSVGSNDLTQYAMAAGRENAFVTEYFLHDHSAIFRLLEHVVQSSGKKTVGICGELATETSALPRLLALGIHEFSVNPLQVPHIKKAFRQTNSNQPSEVKFAQNGR